MYISPEAATTTTTESSAGATNSSTADSVATTPSSSSKTLVAAAAAAAAASDSSFVVDPSYADDWDFHWADVHWIFYIFDQIHLADHQRVNHFRNHYEVGRSG